MVCG
ncbi:hypothetical protein E2C01_090967 [Portunus trituberculatus]|jgi:hypothetical protein